MSQKMREMERETRRKKLTIVNKGDYTLQEVAAAFYNKINNILPKTITKSKLRYRGRG